MMKTQNKLLHQIIMSPLIYFIIAFLLFLMVANATSKTMMKIDRENKIQAIEQKVEKNSKVIEQVKKKVEKDSEK